MNRYALLGLATALLLPACTPPQSQPPSGQPSAVTVSRWDCGDRPVTLTGAGDAAWLQIGANLVAMERRQSPPGARYASVTGPETALRIKGDRARLVGDHRPAVTCTRAPRREPPVFEARGNEPGWLLRLRGGRIDLTAAYGERRLRRDIARARHTKQGLRLVAPGAAGERPLVVHIADRLCGDSMTGTPHPASVRITLDGSTRRGCGGTPQSLLTRHRWILTPAGPRPAADAHPATLTFTPDGRVHGRVGCNRFTGRYRLTPAALRLSQLAATRRACAPAVMERERRLLTALRAVHRFSRPDRATLLLHTDGRATLRAIAADTARHEGQ